MVVQSRSFRVILDSKQSVSFLIFFCIIINQLTISLISEKEKDWSLTGVNWEYVKTAGHLTCILDALRWRLYIGHQTSHLNRSNDRVECLLERYLVKMNFYHPKRPSEFLTKAQNRERRWIKEIHSLPKCLIEWSVRCMLNRSMLFWHLSQNQIRKGKKKLRKIRSISVILPNKRLSAIICMTDTCVWHHLKTKHQIDWHSATCIMYSTDCYQRLTLGSWFTNLEQTPLNRSQQLLAPYKRLIDEIKQN